MIIINIYKITNKINNKVYIGQSKYDIEKRFARHIQDAMQNRLNTHLAKAIRKYGPENFYIELIDTADNQDELNQKEHDMIHYYNSIKDGYNETDSINRSGGNTYSGKSEEEMIIIKKHLSQAKSGENNPNSRKIKCYNVKTKEELHFNTLKQAADYFNEKNHNFVSRRCQKETRYLYKKEWLIAYEEDEYPTDYTTEKGNRKSKQIDVIDLETNKKYNFESFASAERFFNLPQKALSSKAYLKGKHFIARKRFDITVLD